MMFNPIPTDAPEFFSDKAHYVDRRVTTSHTDTDDTQTWFYIFKMGRSVKKYHLRDKYLDAKALEVLLQAKHKGTRLVVKGYSSPSLYGSSMFVVLTHIGIYHKLSHGGYRVYNPRTGELGFYRLRTY